MRLRPGSSVLLSVVLISSSLSARPQDDANEIDIPLGLPAQIDALAKPGHAAAAALGKRLFFDPVLSLDRTVSCATCHDPEHGFSVPQALPLGIGGRRCARNSPTLFNRALGEAQMWDGKASTLEEQVLMPIFNPNEMGLPMEQALQRLLDHDDYPRSFTATFGEPPSGPRLADALSAYIRGLLLGDSPIDRFRAGNAASLTAAERQGLWIFESRGRCWRCHSGPNFSDESFHNTGVGAEQGRPEPGRAAVTGDQADLGAFKTPTLRALAHTAPYMHDGSVATLRDVVSFYRDGGNKNDHLDPLMQPLELSDEDVDHLVAFLECLSRQADEESE